MWILKRPKTIWGPESTGPVTLEKPTNEIRDVIITTANEHLNWDPLRIFEELREGTNLDITEENVHWVLYTYGLREYTRA